MGKLSVKKRFAGKTKAEISATMSRVSKNQWSNIIKIEGGTKQKRMGTWFYKCLDCRAMANFESFLTKHNCLELDKEIGANY